MDTINTFVLIVGSIVVGLGFIGAAANALGVDSRPSIGDDHAR